MAVRRCAVSGNAGSVAEINVQPGAKLHDLLVSNEIPLAAAYLQQFPPPRAADLLMELSFEEQQLLFRALAPRFAAALVPRFPYYHSYVLLHTRPAEEMRAIVNEIDPADRMRFLDELPEETWQRLMEELSGQAAAPPVSPEAAPARVEESGVSPARPLRRPGRIYS